MRNYIVFVGRLVVGLVAPPLQLLTSIFPLASFTCVIIFLWIVRFCSYFCSFTTLLSDILVIRPSHLLFLALIIFTIVGFIHTVFTSVFVHLLNMAISNCSKYHSCDFSLPNFQFIFASSSNCARFTGVYNHRPYMRILAALNTFLAFNIFANDPTALLPLNVLWSILISSCPLLVMIIRKYSNCFTVSYILLHIP